jgi:hypothetical protein
MSAALAPERPAAAAVPWGDAQTLKDVRPHVAKLLSSSKAFAELSPEEAEKLAGETVKVATYMANPDGLAREDIDEHGVPLAEAQADATEEARKRAASSPGFAGKDFQAGAVQQGVEQFGQLVTKVDFPAFCAGLINGVFKAIVDSSIQQMRAYGDLIANVAKTVDQFASDNISENNARDFLVDKYPGELGVSTDQEAGGFDAAAPAPAATPTPQLQTTGQDPEEFLKRVSADYNLTKELTDLSDADQERQLVHSARLQIAKSRQQLLSSMVMLGINRIVVTDGLINAKVVFDMRAQDTAQRVANASMYDQQKTSVSAHTDMNYDSWFSPVSAHTSIDARNDHMATVQSSLDETSTSQAEVKAKLTGEVRVNFKSDYLPLEKMANPAMIAAIQGNATPLDTTATVKPATAAPAAGAAPGR